MIKINLLPRKKKSNAPGREFIIGCACIFLVLSVSLFFYVQFKFKIKALTGQIAETKRQIENSKVKVEQINQLKKDKESLERKLNLIKDMKSKQKGPASILNDIASYIPEKVWLTSLSSKTDEVSLEGMSLTENSIAHFMENLEGKAKLFNIELDKIIQTASDDKKVKKFKITASIIDPDKKSKQQQKQQQQKQEQQEKVANGSKDN